MITRKLHMDRVVPYPCITCQRKVRPKQQVLQCDGCEQWQHRTCHTGISQEEYRQAVLSKIDIQWTCTGCGDVSAVSTTTSLIQPATPTTMSLTQPATTSLTQPETPATTPLTQPETPSPVTLPSTSTPTASLPRLVSSMYDSSSASDSESLSGSLPITHLSSIPSYLNADFSPDANFFPSFPPPTVSPTSMELQPTSPDVNNIEDHPVISFIHPSLHGVKPGTHYFYSR
ncbi:mucin-2-like [Scylla paramamosain]|uniref:mucin-2-like n=1 Tax=Scylla paramamosain TaxID=85552 RepID=UPI003083CC33